MCKPFRIHNPWCVGSVRRKRFPKLRFLASRIQRSLSTTRCRCPHPTVTCLSRPPGAGRREEGRDRRAQGGTHHGGGKGGHPTRWASGQRRPEGRGRRCSNCFRADVLCEHGQGFARHLPWTKALCVCMGMEAVTNPLPSLISCFRG